MSDDQNGDDYHGDDQRDEGLARRTILRIAGAGAALSLGSVVATGQDEDTPAPPPTPTADGPPGTGTPGEDATGDQSAGAPPPIDPAFGYSGTPDDEVPAEYEPAATVSLRTLTQTGAVLGDFAFDPVGLHVEIDDVVLFEASAPEHTVTAYHEAQDRWQRVPTGVPPLSSPALAEGGFWLYRFTEPGVYDLFCASHEFYGMAMRVVVGDLDEWTVVRNRDGRPPFGAAQAVFDQSALDPAAIVEAGSVPWDALDLEGDGGGGDGGTDATSGAGNATTGDGNATGGDATGG